MTSDQDRRALNEAQRLAEHGYALTPVTITRKANGKKKADFRKQWRHESVWPSDPEQILAWWADNTDTSFAIGCAVNGLEGVDLDVKPAEKVDAVTRWAEKGFPAGSLIQDTPSGGMHHLWRVRADGLALPQEAGTTLGRGVDTRNRAGLFFAAGAHVLGEEGTYEVVGPLPKLVDLAETPREVVDLFADAAAAERPNRPTDGRIVEHDEEWQRGQREKVLATIREHRRDAGGYRVKLQHAGLFFGRFVEQGFLGIESAEREILDAHRTVWGADVWPENLKDIRDALNDGPGKERWRLPTQTPSTDTPSDQVPTRRLRVTRASQVRVRRQRWVWADRIILGGLTLLAGREGLGKSTLACWLTAMITRGTLPGEFEGTPRTVIYVHTEDARDTTIVPRLVAAGADLERVVFVDLVTTGEYGEIESQVVFPSNVAAVAELAVELDAALLVLDAATSVIDSKLDGDKDRQMRQGLEAIARGIGERADCGVLGLVHFGKRDSSDTGKLILGSIAWSQVARSVLALARDEDNDTLVLSATKANLAPSGTPSLSVRLTNTAVDTSDGEVTYAGRAEIVGETSVDARDLLAAAPVDSEARTETDEARAWLEDYLDAEGKIAKRTPVFGRWFHGRFRAHR